MVKMNALGVTQLKGLPAGKHCDGRGLWLHKRADGAQWVYRFTLWGRTREMGLGSLRDVGLADAREAAEAARAFVRREIDPIRERRAARALACRRDGRLAQIAEDAFEAHRPSLKSDTAAEKWYATLRKHILPKLGKIPVVKLDQHDIQGALGPIWHEKNVTARKAMSRLDTVLRYAIAQGFEVDPGIIGRARILLGNNLKPAVHIKHLPYAEVPGFYATLDDQTPAQLALRMLILTGVRSDAVNNMRAEQVDGAVWTIPTKHVKGRKQHLQAFRVPLSPEARRLIGLATRASTSEFLFPNSRGGPLDKMAMRNFLVDRGLEARPHGFRSSLRTWLGEETDCEKHVAEACICHLAQGSVEKAYNRTDYFVKREPLMLAWSQFVTGRSDPIANAA